MASFGGFNIRHSTYQKHACKRSRLAAAYAFSSSTALQVCVSTVSIVCNRCCSFRDPSKAGLIAVRAIPAGGTDDADGSDGIFSARAHPDHPRPQPAFTRERDLD